MYRESVHSGLPFHQATGGPMIHPYWITPWLTSPTSCSPLVTPQTVLSTAIRTTLKRPDHFSSLLKPSAELQLSPHDLTRPCSDLPGPHGLPSPTSVTSLLSVLLTLLGHTGHFTAPRSARAFSYLQTNAIVVSPCLNVFPPKLAQFLEVFA